MSLDRPNLTLDESSFEGLLSAAFVIQQHNDRRKRASQNGDGVKSATSVACRHCGALKPSADSRCPACGQDEFRKGERLQRNWASMWSESKEQEELREREQESARDSVITAQANVVNEGRENIPSDDELSENLDLDATLRSLPQVYEEDSELGHGSDSDQLHPSEGQDASRGRAPWNRRNLLEAQPEQDSAFNTSEPSSVEPPAGDTGLVHTPVVFEPEIETRLESATNLDLTPTFDHFDSDSGYLAKVRHRVSELQVKLRFRRADLYLGLSVFIAAIALLWPSAGSSRAPSLSLWERALVTLGIAEAPAPVVHLQGDPSVNVWIDPHTALYYCQGDEQFQKTPDGRLSTQREAQVDRFEPASRLPCE